MTKKINYHFPAEEIRKEIKKNKQEIVNLILPENASLTDKVKYEISQNILTYQQENNLTYEEISHRIGLPLSQTMEILRGNVSIFALDSLTSYIENLHLPLQVKITKEERTSI